MRNITITGFIAQDPEWKDTKRVKDGVETTTTWCRMRLGNSEYGDKQLDNGNRETSWFTVIPNRTDMPILKVLKKGSQVIVTGHYSDALYTSQTGVQGIDRTIRAYDIQFMGVPRDGQKNESKQTATTPQPEPPRPATPAPNQPAPAPQNKAAAPAQQTIAMPSAEDDLPF